MPFVAVLAIAIIGLVLWDAFGTIVLPRRMVGPFRLSAFVYRSTWLPWRWAARRLRQTGQQDFLMSLYGPLSLIVLLVIWIAILLLCFALLHWTLGSRLNTPDGHHAGFGDDLYMSGTTIFTLGLGDLSPQTSMAKIVTVLEAGTGFGLLALVIGYLPIVYQAFSRREANIALLDARAGSPPSAFELLRRYCRDDHAGLNAFFETWERWCAELLESHLSYPALAFFRSQHERQSWLSALTMILDATALILAGVVDAPRQSARLTFAMARHAAVDLSQFLSKPLEHTPERLPTATLEHAIAALRASGLPVNDDAAVHDRLTAIRELYEPFVAALAHQLALDLPPWLGAEDAHDDWQTSMWETLNDQRKRSLIEIENDTYDAIK